MACASCGILLSPASTASPPSPSGVFLPPPSRLSFRRSISVRLPLPSRRPVSLNCFSPQIRAGTGYYPASISWWKKGQQTNMLDINSEEEFHDALERAGDKVVVVDFYSPGCRSCKAMHPKICQLAAENPEIVVLKVNFYDNSDLCRSLRVSILPFFHIYKHSDGLVDAFSCSLTKVSKLREAVARHKRGLVTAFSTARSVAPRASDLLPYPSVLVAAAAPS